MKTKKEIMGKTHDELEKMLEMKGEALRTFRFNLSGSKTKNVRDGRTTRRQIAMIKTHLRRKKNENGN